MNYFFSSRFRRLLKKLDFRRKEDVKRAINELSALFDLGLKSKGLGLKKLQANIWEFRVSLDDRIVFSLEGENIFFLLLGNHDDVNKFLRSR